jgi:CDP-diglyceride synthetase
LILSSLSFYAFSAVHSTLLLPVIKCWLHLNFLALIILETWKRLNGTNCCNPSIWWTRLFAWSVCLTSLGCQRYLSVSSPNVGARGALVCHRLTRLPEVP